MCLEQRNGLSILLNDLIGMPECIKNKRVWMGVRLLRNRPVGATTSSYHESGGGPWTKPKEARRLI